ncbi:MAG TPA: cell division protein FtsA [Candidatus Saccharimonadales bacterium]|nr:cell division protein FtsA [Candidatus Saccharimonadales bacterium]
MQEITRYGVGIDVGTTHVRCVIGHLDDSKSGATIIGVGVAPNNGMRKGSVVNIVDTAHAIDKALEEAERMSGHQVGSASVSVNGSHIMAMSSKGVVAVNSQNNEITDEDIARVGEAATVVQLPANREILQVTPRSYTLDDQTNIKDPIGMSGVRLEVDAHVVTALGPNIKNLLKSLEMTQTAVNNVVVAGLAAAKAVVTNQQMENGVAIVDFGGTTTQIVVYEEGDLQHLSILPVGSVNITNDLAIGLRTDLDIAEDLKLQHVSKVLTVSKDRIKNIEYVQGDKKVEFSAKDIKMIVEARLDEIFEMIDKELRSIDKSGKLPGGVVLTGAGANLTHIADYAKDRLRLPARVAHISSINGMSDKVAKPDFATALGLMLIDLESSKPRHKSPKGKNSFDAGSKMFGKLFNSAGDFMRRFKP